MQIEAGKNGCCCCSSRPDGKALERFLQSYFDGSLKPYLKSEPLPENNDGPVKVSWQAGLQLC